MTGAAMAMVTKKVSTNTPGPAVGWRKNRRPGAVARTRRRSAATTRSEEHTSELQSQSNLVCRLLLEQKKKTSDWHTWIPARRKSERVNAYRMTGDVTSVVRAADRHS